MARNIVIASFKDHNVDNKRTNGVRIDIFMDPNVRQRCDNDSCTELWVKAHLVDSKSIRVDFPADRSGICTEGPCQEMDKFADIVVDYHKNFCAGTSQAKLVRGMGAIPMKSLKLSVELKMLSYLFKFENLEHGLDNTILSPHAKEDDSTQIASIDIPFKTCYHGSIGFPEEDFTAVSKHAVSWFVAFEYSGHTDLTRKQKRTPHMTDFQMMMEQMKRASVDEDGDATMPKADTNTSGGWPL